MFKKVLGLGNALTDILLQINSDDVLVQLKLPKGSMQLIDQPKLTELMARFDYNVAIKVSGGSASNTINGITKLGIPAGFIGKIGNDEVGEFFLNDSIKNGVEPIFGYSSLPSGNCTVLVSPDGERTMCTFLGAAADLKLEDLTDEAFQGYSVFHIEGYMVQNHALIRKAVGLAKQNGLLVSIDLASFNVVEEHLDFLKEIVSEYIDIVFANEEEAKAFTGKEPHEALIQLAEHCSIAVVKIGKDGSLIKAGDVSYTIAPFSANSIDTTGAGDLYAAGFLYGLAVSLPLDVCGKIGSLVSSKVVEVMGAKMSQDCWDDIKVQIDSFVA